ncbi:polyamine transport protein [Colletotrichum asianum]
MRKAQRTRSFTPPTEVQRLTDPSTLAYKESVLRRYSSAERLGRRTRNQSSSSIPTSFLKFCCTPQAELALKPQLVEKKPAMLSNFFHPTKTADLHPSPEATGDFDNTPSPSLRPSMADMSLKKPEQDVDSISSARSGVFRHALLKTGSGRPMVVDRDLPAPPVLSQQINPDEPLEQVVKEKTPEEKGYEHKATASLPSRNYSQEGTSSATESDSSHSRERICVDPELHPDESHIKARHRGLLKGADFCDTGVPGQPVAQLPEDEDEDDDESDPSKESEPTVILARVKRAMTGDDNCLSTVEITLSPKVEGHSRARKVRPAFNTPTFHYSVDPANPGNPVNTISQQASLGVSKQDKYFADESEASADEEPPKSDKSRAQSVSRSRAGTLDYKRTAQWIRDLLKNPERPTRLTELPSRSQRSSYMRLEDSPEPSPISRKLTRKSTLPPSKVEAGLFQRTFGELERLLHEALTLASQVADHEEESHDFSDVDLDNNNQETHSLSKRAATYPNIDPRARELVDDLYRNISLTPHAKHNPLKSRNTGGEANFPERDIAGRPLHNHRGISLRGKSHVSLRGVQAFNLPKSKRRQPIARDWSPIRKRAVATVACISTALIGVLLGIYAGLVPSLQYYIWDSGHTILNGNVGCFLASMNFHSILTDLFGASLMSSNPHQEVVDDYDSRRHGGGMGVWLGIWTWCFIASLGFGFWIGAWVIDDLQPAWGFYVSVILIAVVLLLNTLCPEVRRSAFRRSVVEVRTGTDVSRRLARGEVMMHRVKDGPKWWGQEMYHGIALSLEMLRQPGFAVIAVYSGWIYAQVVLIIVLLGSLSSRFYKMRSPYVGLMVAALAFGAIAAIPFQKASYFSRARHTQVNTSRMTFDKQITWTSHLLRRTVFTIGLPLAGIVYAGVSGGPPLHPSAPATLAAVIGFLSCLAISECNGIIMETFDTSDLQPGMTGRPRGNSDTQRKKNYSAFPRVTAGFAICHTFGFVFAAGATGLGSMAQRTLGQRVSTGVVAGILLILTVLLFLVLIRFKEVTIIPESKTEEMDRWTTARKESLKRRESIPEEKIDEKALFAEEEPWRPFIVGNPTSKTRRVNVLELGGMSRFTEIRKRNRLIDASAHLNRAALDAGLDALDDQLSDIVSDIVNDAKDILRRVSENVSEVNQ